MCKILLLLGLIDILNLNFIFYIFYFRTAPLVGGWDVSAINVTKECFHIQWSKLTLSEIDQPIRVYVLVVTFTKHHQLQVIGRIVPSNTSSTRICGLSPYRKCQVKVVAVDESAQLHKSSETFVTTEQDG